MLNSVLNTSHRTIFHHHTSDISDCRSSRWQMFFRIGVLKNFAIFTGKRLYCSCFVIKLQAFRSRTLLKETPRQVFSYEYCEVFKNSFFYRTPLVAASLTTKNINFDYLQLAHFMSLVSFYTSWKPLVSLYFRGYRKKLVTWNGLSFKIWVWSNLWFNSSMTKTQMQSK